MCASDAIWRHRSGSILIQVMTCYPGQCWILISEVPWHSSECNFAESVQATILYNEFENCTFEITTTPCPPMSSVYISVHLGLGKTIAFCVRHYRVDFLLKCFPFWLKFAQNCSSSPNISPLHNTITLMTLGGRWALETSLTHWGRVTHICVSRLTIIASDNGLSPGRRQAIIWTSAGILSIGPLGTNFSEILIAIITFSFKKMRLKVSSAKWRPCCLGFNVLNCCLFARTRHYFMPSLLNLLLRSLPIGDGKQSRPASWMSHKSQPIEPAYHSYV